ncbi:MAG: HEPN domain-containing protein [Armatimonadetes bacterium]|nr:HEPN domain-containing protein [Armatimonadota bacterium]
MANVTVSLESLQPIVQLIVEEFRPHRVILFGSQARGEAREGSDIDICVVLDTKGQPNHEVARKIQQAVCELAPKVPWRDRFVRVPIQVHVFAPEEFEASLLRAGVFATNIAREGIVLYEAEGVVPISELLAKQRPWEGPEMKPETMDWVNLAEGDWAAAQWQRQAPSPVPHVICFLAQQCAEKYLKAFLEEHNIPFPRTHDLIELLNLCGGMLEELDAIKAELMRLSEHAVLPRYPGITLTLQQVDEAMQIAERVREVIRSKLGLP